MTEALREVSNWAEDNGLGINSEKTQDTRSETVKNERINTCPFKRGETVRSHPGL